MYVNCKLGLRESLICKSPFAGLLQMRLFLYLLVYGVLVAELAEFIELNLALNKLLVLAGPVVHVFTALAAEFYQLIL